MENISLFDASTTVNGGGSVRCNTCRFTCQDFHTLVTHVSSRVHLDAMPPQLPFVCFACKKFGTGEAVRKAHMTSAKHKKNAYSLDHSGETTFVVCLSHKEHEVIKRLAEAGKQPRFDWQTPDAVLRMFSIGGQTLDLRSTPTAVMTWNAETPEVEDDTATIAEVVAVPALVSFKEVNAKVKEAVEKATLQPIPRVNPLDLEPLREMALNMSAEAHEKARTSIQKLTNRSLDRIQQCIDLCAFSNKMCIQWQTYLVNHVLRKKQSAESLLHFEESFHRFREERDKFMSDMQGDGFYNIVKSMMVIESWRRIFDEHSDDVLLDPNAICITAAFCGCSDVLAERARGNLGHRHVPWESCAGGMMDLHLPEHDHFHIMGQFFGLDADERNIVKNRLGLVVEDHQHEYKNPDLRPGKWMLFNQQLSAETIQRLNPSADCHHEFLPLGDLLHSMERVNEELKAKDAQEAAGKNQGPPPAGDNPEPKVEAKEPAVKEEPADVDWDNFGEEQDDEEKTEAGEPATGLIADVEPVDDQQVPDKPYGTRLVWGKPQAPAGSAPQPGGVLNRPGKAPETNLEEEVAFLRQQVIELTKENKRLKNTISGGKSKSQNRLTMLSDLQTIKRIVSHY